MTSAYSIIKKDDPLYPARLAEIHRPPAALYVRGNVAVLSEPQIAIVGCRQMTAYGSENAFQFAKALAEMGITVTSGLALGIDTMAHQGALAGKGATIAVLGTGLNNIYPPQNQTLAALISEQGGAVISEFPLDTPAFPYNFPKRNRIISALSLGVLVIEAAEKSGSLITARFALEQNREVFAIPGSIHNPTSRGCHTLIAAGAVLVQSLPDLLLHLKAKLQEAVFPLQVAEKNLQSAKKHGTPIKKNDHPLLVFFSSEPTPLDVILAKTGLSIESLNGELLMLELAGAIKMETGGYIRILRMQKLVIVESPAKSKTITKYLGEGFKVLASYGHVRDLAAKKGAVNPEEDFAMKYEPIAKNSKHVDEIVKAMKTAQTLYLATDPDREGEAISWHLLELLKAKKLLKGKTVHRVVFHEITKTAIQNAMEHPRELSLDLVDAQQARRALDYLVGFNLSPLLWKKVARGLSAGRVQSPALRLIVEREEEIEKFVTQEYWSILAHLSKDKIEFTAKLTQYLGNPVKQFDINNTDLAHEAKQTLLTAAQGSVSVKEVQKKQKKRNPTAPFITSTLQQEAIRKLGFTAKKAMMIAQNLYEGLDTGEGVEGLITYMRTDSVVLSQEATAEMREYIIKEYGADSLPDAPRVYKSKAKNAQEAHEAVRPTSILRTPQAMKKYLTPDQFKLYDLIWKRTLASQMQHALIDTLAVDFAAGDKGIFRATGSAIAKPGFMTVYQEDLDDAKTAEEENARLPHFKEGDVLPLQDIETKQHFTEPPPRYSEASLVKALEEFGIGRPSTYASIISTLQLRQYVTLDNKRFKPTDVARVVNKFLNQYFTRYVDYHFTAKLEDELDNVARGEEKWVPLLEKFWEPFKTQITETEANVKRSDITQEAMDEACPDCGKPLSIRLSRNGRFIGCTAYPECKYTRALEKKEGEAEPEPELLERNCPDCDSPLQYRMGRFGKFIGCTNYPKCKHIESLNKPESTGITCPICDKGELVGKKSRYGKLFYSCNRYPECKYAIWNKPIEEPCPKCAWPFMTIKETKRRGVEKVCPKEGCDYIGPG